jgi:hypothetical protein
MTTDARLYLLASPGVSREVLDEYGHLRHQHALAARLFDTMDRALHDRPGYGYRNEAERRVHENLSRDAEYAWRQLLQFERDNPEDVAVMAEMERAFAGYTEGAGWQA